MAARNFDGLVFATVKMFKVFQNLESVIEKHFEKSTHIYTRDTYEKVMAKLPELELLNLGCDSHHDLLPYLIMEYVQIRFHFEARRYRNLLLSKIQTAIHTDMKKSRTK